MDWIAVRFHFGGTFVNVDGLLLYVGGETAESRIELDKLSFFEITGHLADHFTSPSAMRMYWLKAGMDLWNGLVLLVDDASCHIMAGYHRDGSIVDLYVEEVAMELPADGEDIWAGVDEANHHANYDTDYAGIMETQKQQDKDYRSFVEFYRSPSKKSIEEKVCIAEDEDQQTDNIGEDEEATNLSDDTSDEEYKQPEDEDSSTEDEETIQLRKYASEIKKNIRSKKLGMHGSQPMEIRAEDLVDEVPNLDDPGSPYLDSSDDYSYEENSEGETERWTSMENRYDSKAPIPVFSLGMVFRCTRQFKKALVKYGLKTHRHLRFLKDEKDRVRVVCTWPGCKWLIYGSITSRSEWCKVVRFDDIHCCLPRRDNKLVTSTLIAKHYYQEIKDNPTWKADLIKNAVQRDFLADVSVSKCKRAKAIVLQQALDSMKGEYSRVYDYQLELLRSNPGSTIVVCLDPDVEDKKVFERFYVCFDGCKKGFLAGCRQVIGLDGCWFKGANNGNLLCAIGRDANNQMYPLAWAAVPIENYETWYWFIGLLQKDLNINNGGEEWVFISDQQKV